MMTLAKSVITGSDFLMKTCELIARICFPRETSARKEETYPSTAFARKGFHM